MFNSQLFIENDISSFVNLERGGDGLFCVGCNGVVRILTPKDRKVEFIVFKDKTLVYVKSAMGYPAIYPLKEVQFEAPAKAVLMDLDGTSVHSEPFWIWIIERVISKLLDKMDFKLEQEDEPHVSGYSVSEHLQYCIDKYCPDKTVEQARKYYFEIVDFELKEIMNGRGRTNAFVPAPGLKEFLIKLKERKVKIGLVTSGLYEKAWPEIVSVFRTLKLGDPLDFYDAIISAGFPLRKGEVGTLGELESKPHPWLYAETARVGLGIESSLSHKVIGIEDSGAGVLSIRLAGFAAIGIDGGNIKSSGVRSLLHFKCENIMEALPSIMGNC